MSAELKIVPEYVISGVPRRMIHVVWPQCVRHLQEVIDRSNGELTIDSLFRRLMCGHGELVTVSCGTEIIACNTLEVAEMTSGMRALYIPCVGGEYIDLWWDDFMDYAIKKAHRENCTELRGMSVRDGWIRKLKQMGYHWRHVHNVIAYDIGEKS